MRVEMPMTTPVRLSDQFAGCSAVSVPYLQASQALVESLHRFGDVRETPLTGLIEIVAHLSPIKSFTTKYAVLNLGAWSLLLTDMKGENCSVNALAVSRTTGCRAIGVTALDQRRELHVYQAGARLRSILSLDDEGTWYYSEAGDPMSFEVEADRMLRPKSRRLSAERVRQYFGSYTGLPFPVWSKLASIDAIGVSRSIKDVRAEILGYDTLNDVIDVVA